MIRRRERGWRRRGRESAKSAARHRQKKNVHTNSKLYADMLSRRRRRRHVQHVCKHGMSADGGGLLLCVYFYTANDTASYMMHRARARFINICYYRVCARAR